jgi:DNA repair photolyase
MIPKGRGAQIQTHNKFLKNRVDYSHPEGIDESENKPYKTQFLIETAKTVVNKITSPDVGMEYSVNPYQGCEHGCVYCYARNTHEYYGLSAGIDFESKIMVKTNAPELLRKQFDHPKWKPAVISFSGNTDCYQPAEKKFKLTRQLLEICLEYGNPASIITKNSLVLRDIDILQEMASKNLVSVYVSVTTLRESIRQKLEPRTATAQKRLRAIQQLSEAGIPVGVMAAPMIPFINAHEMPDILKAAAEHGAKRAGYIFVRLNGSIGVIFEDWIRQQFPDHAERVLNNIKNAHGGQLNDSRFGTRMKGEGHMAEIISMQFTQLHKKLFGAFPKTPYDFSHFRRPEKGQLRLF